MTLIICSCYYEQDKTVNFGMSNDDNKKGRYSFLPTIGQIAVKLAISDPGDELQRYIVHLKSRGYKVLCSHVGSMQMEKIIASIETAARREEIISDVYRDEHALYHSILDALAGVCRGQLALDKVLRTVGLKYSVVVGPKNPDGEKDDCWLVVVLYGTIGAPIKGFEHEVIGLGTYHI